MPPDWLIEFLAVGGGVYLALWVQRRADFRRDRALESAYVASLASDLEDDLATISAMAGRIRGYAEAIQKVLVVINDESTAVEDPAHFVQLMSTTRFIERFQPTTATMDELTGSGGWRVMRERDRLRAVLTYHRRVEDSRTSYHFMMRKTLDNLWPALKTAVDPALFPPIIAKLYHHDYSADNPYGDGPAGFLTDADPDGSLASAAVDLNRLRSHPTLRTALLDHLENLVVLEGELGLYETLCRDAKNRLLD